jgi:hypothetical protein
MNEHDDDLEPEVDENGEFETAEFHVQEQEEDAAEPEAPAMPEDEAFDPDDSEV